MTGIAQKIISNPEAYSIEMLTQGVQNGSVPAYIGIPLIQQKTQQLKTSQALAAAPQQPPIAQQVLDQAQQTVGLQGLPSNLPAQAYAPGGIVAFAEGGDAEDDEEDEFDMGKDEQQLFEMLRRRLATAPEYEEMEGLAALPIGTAKAVTTKREVSSKVGNEPKQTRSEGITQLTKEGTPDGDLINKIMMKESGGRRYDKQGNLLTSPKGAMGEMQVMPATSRDPGYGIRPARAGDADDLARVGREYFGKMMDKYGDPKLAAIAYNWGPGNTDKWLMAGADPSKLPRETQKYSADMAGGGEVHFDGGGIADIFKMTPDEIKEYMKKQRLMERVKDAFGKSDFAQKPTAAEPARLGPTATQNQPSTSIMSRLGSLIKNPYTAVGAGGAGITALTGNYLNRLSDEELQALQNSGGGDDTGLAAAIMLQGRKNSAQAPEVQKPSPAPAPQSNKPFVQPSVSEAQATALAGPQAAVPPNVPEAMGETAAPEAAEAPGAMTNYLGEYAQYLKDRRAQMAADKEENKYLALLQAGLGMMGGTSPYAAANIGQGASQGVAAYMAGQKQASADDRALQQGMLGLTRADLYEKMHLADLAQKKALTGEANATRAARQAASEREGMEKLAAGIEAQIGRSIDASGKLAALEAIGKSGAEIAAERQRLINQTLMGNTTQARRYQAIMKKLGYDIDEQKGGSSGVLNYDPTTRTLR